MAADASLGVDTLSGFHGLSLRMIVCCVEAVEVEVPAHSQKACNGVNMSWHTEMLLHLTHVSSQDTRNNHVDPLRLHCCLCLRELAA